MRQQEIFEGKTVEHAIEEACRHFQCSKEGLEVEIITRGSTGIFGIGSRKAKIKAGPKVVPASPQEEEPVPKEGGQKEEEGQEDRYYSEEDSEVKGLEPSMNEARTILEELLSRAGMEGKVTVRMDTSNGPYLDIEGDDLSLIIGKNGQNLMAFKYIMNLMLKRRHPGCPIVEVDAQGYLERRKRTLKSQARRIAEKVRRTGRSLSLEPMNAKERRMIHLAIKGMKGVTTKSVGDGALRRVIIVPARRRNGERQRSFKRD